MAFSLSSSLSPFLGRATYVSTTRHRQHLRPPSHLRALARSEDAASIPFPPFFLTFIELASGLIIYAIVSIRTHANLVTHPTDVQDSEPRRQRRLFNLSVYDIDWPHPLNFVFNSDVPTEFLNI